MANQKKSATQAPQPDQPIELKSGNTVSTAKELLNELENSRSNASLLVIHLFWGGCRNACGHESELDKALDDLSGKFSFQLANVPWREGFFDDEIGTYFYDYRMPETEAYQVVRESLKCKTERLGGFDTIDSYSVPPWDRPHFPQLLFIDPAEIDKDHLAEIVRASDGFVDSDQWGNIQRELVTEEGELILSIERIIDPKGNLSAPNNYFADPWNQHHLQGLFPPASVLLQLVNEHLYARPDHDLQVDALTSSFECVLNSTDPRNCITYMRGPIVKGCGKV